MPEQPLAAHNMRLKAILQAILVTFLWSTSWVLIKIGLKDNLPPITFAGLRYTLAFLCLLPLMLANPTHRSTLRNIPGLTWVQLAVLGLIIYSLTQGAQFVGLVYLPAATLTLLLNFTPVLVALASGRVGNESPSPRQWLGILLSIIGALVYFLPLGIPAGQGLGLLVGLIGLLANSGSSLLGREVNLRSGLSPLIVTTVSMGIGGLLLLAVGALSQGFGQLNLTGWLIIAWLAIVNTAFAFTLWNRTLHTLTAVESSIINNTMMPQIAILAWLFLGEPLNARQVAGIILVLVGTLLVQLWQRVPTRAGKVAIKPDQVK